MGRPMGRPVLPGGNRHIGHLFGPQLLKPGETSIDFPVMPTRFNPNPNPDSIVSVPGNGYELFLRALCLIDAGPDDDGVYLQDPNDGPPNNVEVVVVTATHCCLAPERVLQEKENDAQLTVNMIKTSFPRTLVKNADNTISQSEEVERSRNLQPCVMVLDDAEAWERSDFAGSEASASSIEFNLVLTEANLPISDSNFKVSYHSNVCLSDNFYLEEQCLLFDTMLRHLCSIDKCINFFNQAVDDLRDRQLHKIQSFIHKKNQNGETDSNFSSEHKEILRDVVEAVTTQKYWTDHPIPPLNNAYYTISTRDTHRNADINSLFTAPVKELPGLHQVMFSAFLPFTFLYPSEPIKREFIEFKDRFNKDVRREKGGRVFHFVIDFNYILVMLSEMLKTTPGRPDFCGSFYYSSPDMCRFFGSNELLDRVAIMIREKTSGAQISFPKNTIIRIFDNGCKTSLLINEPGSGTNTDIYKQIELSPISFYGDAAAYAAYAPAAAALDAAPAAAPAAAAAAAAAAALEKSPFVVAVLQSKSNQQFSYPHSPFNCLVPLPWASALIPRFNSCDEFSFYHPNADKFSDLKNVPPNTLSTEPFHKMDDDDGGSISPHSLPGDEFFIDSGAVAPVDVEGGLDLRDTCIEMRGITHIPQLTNGKEESDFIATLDDLFGKGVLKKYQDAFKKPDLQASTADWVDAWAKAGQVHKPPRALGPYESTTTGKKPGGGRGGASKKKCNSILTRRSRRPRKGGRSRRSRRLRRSRKGVRVRTLYH